MACKTNKQLLINNIVSNQGLAFPASFPVPRTDFHVRTASDEKLGVGLGMRLALCECSKLVRLSSDFITLLYGHGMPTMHTVRGGSD